MREITLHIGNYKTGSTSIQNAIAANRSRLIAAGYYIPKAGFAEGAHHDWARSWMKRPMAPPAEGLFESIRKELAQTTCDRILVSSEVLFGCGCEQKIVDALPGYKFRVVGYLRRQDHFYSAFYQQLVKHAYFRETREPTIALLESSNSTHYLKGLERWADAIGEDNVAAFAFERPQLGAGLLPHFFSWLGLRDPETYQTKKGEDALNVTIHNELLEFLRASNSFAHDRQDHMALLSLLTRIAELPGADDAFHKKSVFSPEERREILSRRAEENQEIANRFLRGRPPGEAPFAEAPPEDDPDWKRSYLDVEGLARISSATWILQQSETLKLLTRMSYSKDGIVQYLLSLNQRLWARDKGLAADQATDSSGRKAE